jgi:hypothetical protein
VQAVTVGLAKTGRLVTAAGIIMFAAFMGFVVGSFVDLQQFGFGLAAAILIDVTIVRALLLPSAMRLFGRWNWWLPANVARIFRVEPSPLQPVAARGGAGWPEHGSPLVRQYRSEPAGVHAPADVTPQTEAAPTAAANQGDN